VSTEQGIDITAKASLPLSIYLYLSSVGRACLGCSSSVPPVSRTDTNIPRICPISVPATWRLLPQDSGSGAGSGAGSG